MCTEGCSRITHGGGVRSVVILEMSHPQPPRLSGSTSVPRVSCLDPPVRHDLQDDIVTERQLVHMRFRAVDKLSGCSGLACRGVLVNAKYSGRLPVSAHTPLQGRPALTDVVASTCVWVHQNNSALLAPRPNYQVRCGCSRS